MAQPAPAEAFFKPRQVLEARDRTLGGITAAPDGLYLMTVQYPERFGIPQLSSAIGLW